MKLLKKSLVQDYKSSLGGKSTYHHVITKCQCIYSPGLPEKVHDAKEASNGYNERPYVRVANYIKFNVSQLSKETYYSSEIIKCTLHDMLNCNEIKKIGKLYCIIDLNFKFHPPCANYMNFEYRHLFISLSDENIFNGMSIWDYLMYLFECLLNGTSQYGKNEVYDLAFQMFFDFCVRILKMDYDYAKKKRYRPVIVSCLNYGRKHNSRIHEVKRYLDMLYDAGYDFAVTVVKFALLLEELK